MLTLKIPNTISNNFNNDVFVKIDGRIKECNLITDFIHHTIVLSESHVIFENLTNNPDYVEIVNYLSDLFSNLSDHDKLVCFRSSNYEEWQVPVITPDTHLYICPENPLQKEIEEGTYVTLIYRFFKDKSDGSIQYNLDTVIVREPIKYLPQHIENKPTCLTYFPKQFSNLINENEPFSLEVSGYIHSSYLVDKIPDASCDQSHKKKPGRVKKPHREITLDNPCVLLDNTRNIPGYRSVVEYLRNSFINQLDKYPHAHFSAITFKDEAMTIVDSDSNTFGPSNPIKQELAYGLYVTLNLSVFKDKVGTVKYRLESVRVNEPIRFKMESKIVKEISPEDFDFDEFRNLYKKVVDGMAIMNISSYGEIGNQVKVEFSEATKKQYDVNFGFKDCCDMNGHHEPQYSAKFSSIHDNKPLEILSGKTVLYGDEIVTSDYLTKHQELEGYINSAITCGEIIVDKANKFVEEAKKFSNKFG